MRKIADGQTVYVLMDLESGTNKTKVWRPVAVVTNPDLAAQWEEYGSNVDWVPLELDDVKQLSPDNRPSFHPRETTPGEQKAIELSKQMEKTIQRLENIIEDQADMIRKLQKGKKTGYKSPLLKEAERTILPEQPKPTGKSPYVYDPSMSRQTKPIAEDPQMKSAPSWVTGAAEDGDSIPPKPVEKVKGGTQPFPDRLDAQGIMDYIAAYASYEVSAELLWDKFLNTHAMLKLVPISELREGGRDANSQSKKNENAYLKQSLKTQPPAVVENGKVLDGNHRFRANKRRGLTHMWCYVVMEGD